MAHTWCCPTSTFVFKYIKWHVTFNRKRITFNCGILEHKQWVSDPYWLHLTHRSNLIMSRVYYILSAALFVLEIPETKVSLAFLFRNLFAQHSVCESHNYCKTLVTVIPCSKTELKSLNLDVFDLHVFQALLENSTDCCERIKTMNETCVNITLCDPGMFVKYYHLEKLNRDANKCLFNTTWAN